MTGQKPDDYQQTSSFTIVNSFRAKSACLVSIPSFRPVTAIHQTDLSEADALARQRQLNQAIRLLNTLVSSTNQFTVSQAIREIIAARRLQP